MEGKKANEFFMAVENMERLCYNKVNTNYLEAEMELGEKILQARLEARLSQRQLCADKITRNMLSQIEHGTAQPSMATLQYLASRLGKSVGYFLEEETVSANQALLSQARRAFRAGDFAQTRMVLEGFQHPDETFHLEYQYLLIRSTLAAAREAVDREKTVYARKLLMDLPDGTLFPGLERQRLLLLGQLQEEGIPEIAECLPPLDEELHLKARAALEAGNFDRGLALLNAMEQEVPQCHLLRGQLLVKKKDYAQAVQWLHKTEEAFPEKTLPLLERCYREMGDFQQAYYYACKQR